MKRIFLLFVTCIILETIFGQDTEYLLKEIKKHKGSVNSVCLSPDGNYLVSGGEGKLLLIYNIKTDEVAYEHTNNYFVPYAIVVTATNNIFLGSGPDIKLIDFNNNTQAVYKGNTTHIRSISYAPERSKIIAGSYDFKLKVWDVETTEVELELEGHKKSTLPVAFSPDEKYIVSGSLDKTVRLWNAKTGEQMRMHERHSDNIYDVAFHPGGKYFASASLDKTIRLWSFETGEVVMTYAGHDNGITDIEFLPDGNHLVSASYDGSIRLWQTKTGKTVYTFTGHVGKINTLSVGALGEIMASGGGDGNVLLWEINNKIFVEHQYYDEFWTDLEANDIIYEKQRGEKKEDYEKRYGQMLEKEKEIVAKYYSKYVNELGNLTFK